MKGSGECDERSGKKLDKNGQVKIIIKRKKERKKGKDKKKRKRRKAKIGCEGRY